MERTPGYLICFVTTRRRAHALVARRADSDGGLPTNAGFRWLQQPEPLCGVNVAEVAKRIRTASVIIPSHCLSASFHNKIKRRREFDVSLALYSPVVDICTTSLKLTKSTFCPHSVFVCFVWI